MNSMLGRTLLLVVAAGSLQLFAGCESQDKGPDQDYNANWKGRTSNGGTVSFTVGGDKVTALEIKDSRGWIRLQQPVDIDGDSFSAEGSSGFLNSTKVSCTFDSATHCTGSYSIQELGQSLSGTFEATRR